MWSGSRRRLGPHRAVGPRVVNHEDADAVGVVLREFALGVEPAARRLDPAQDRAGGRLLDGLPGRAVLADEGVPEVLGVGLDGALPGLLEVLGEAAAEQGLAGALAAVDQQDGAGAALVDGAEGLAEDGGEALPVLEVDVIGRELPEVLGPVGEQEELLVERVHRDLPPPYGSSRSSRGHATTGAGGVNGGRGARGRGASARVRGGGDRNESLGFGGRAPYLRRLGST